MDDVASDLLGIGEACSMRQSIGHGGLHWSRLDGNHAHSDWIQPAAESLKEEREATFSRSINVVGAATPISSNGGDGSDAACTAALQLSAKQGQKGRSAGKINLQFF